MKKVVAIVLILAVAAAGGFWYMKTKKKKAEAAVAATTVKVETVTRGDIVQKVEASGVVTSNLDVEIKCKASGEIVSLPYEVSDYVEKGSLVLQLDPTDEERNVRKARISLISAQSTYKKAIETLRVTQKEIADQRNQALVNLETVKSQHDDLVAKADRIKQLYDKKLVSREEYETSRTSVVESQNGVKQAKLKLEAINTSEESLSLKRQDVEQARTQVESSQISLSLAEQALDNTRVYAPVSGVITAMPVSLGTIISSGISNVGGGTSVMTISDLSKLYVLASVDESDIGSIKQGQMVEISADAYSDYIFAGRVERIAQKGVATSNVVTFEVKIEVLGKSSAKGLPALAEADKSMAPHPGGGMPPAGAGFDGKKFDPSKFRGKRDGQRGAPGNRGSNSKRGAGGYPSGMPGGQGAGAVSSKGATAKSLSAADPNLLKPQMTTDVAIVIANRKNITVVPADAIFRMNGKKYVTIDSGNGKTQQKEVVTGISDDENTEVISGLSEGDKVQVTATETDSQWSGKGARGGMMFGAPRGRR